MQCPDAAPRVPDRPPDSSFRFLSSDFGVFFVAKLRFLL
jgi:hypothetical protein